MNEIIIDLIVLFLGMFSQVYLNITTINMIFKLELANKERIVFSLISGIILALFKLFATQPLSSFNPFLYIILNVLLFTGYKKISIIKSLLYSFLIIVISIPIEIISGIIAYKVMNLSNNYGSVIATIPVLVIIDIWYIIIVAFLFLFKKKEALQLQFNNNFILINILIVTLLFAPNVMFYAVNKYNYPVWLLIYNIISNIALVLLSIFNTYKYVQLEITERNLKNSEMHNKSLNELVDSIRVFKHDYNNVVHAIGGYVATNDMEGLKNYYDGLAKDSKKVNQLENISPDKINEPSIYGIFASKYQTAESKYIEFNFESMINYKNLAMPVYDFCKILGVLLDNAIEAAEECDEKKINVSIRESKKTGVQLISIENTYLNKEIDTEKIYEKDYSTKHRNSGLGLWEVKNIVNRNKNVKLITTKNEQYFKQELYIKTS